MKIFQLVPSMLFGDAVGNDVLAFYDVLKEAGFETAIYTYSTDKRLQKDYIGDVKAMPSLEAEDIVLYHMACGSEMSDIYKDLPCKKVLVYHNITPPHFFEPYDDFATKVCESGYDELKTLAECTDYCLAVSEYNKQDLIRMGFKCKIDVLPIVIPFSDYDRAPAENILKDYGEDDYVNILFVGRVVPNKKHEDIIKAFFAYQRIYNKKSRLILVGSSKEKDRYKERLMKYITTLNVKNVIFPGHIRFDEIIGFYKVADVFLCQSEHEGFCVPLAEAMYLKTPILAYDAAAIADTLSGAGILLKEKDPVITAGFIDKLVKDKELRKTVLENQEERLKDFSHEKISSDFLRYLDGFINS